MNFAFLALLLLFYKPAQFVISAPINHDISADWNTDSPPRHVPAMAQKAGGSWRPELLPAESAPTSHVIEANENSSQKKVVMHAMAQKAGGSWKQEVMPGATDRDSEPKNNPEDEHDYYDDEEIECPENMFFHVRSRLCVPFKCPRNTQRDKESGQCIEESLRMYTRRVTMDLLNELQPQICYEKLICTRK